MPAVFRPEEEKLAIEGIAERQATRVQEAGNRVEEELLAFIGVLKAPVFTAVGCFLDAGFLAFAAGHQVSGGGVESDDSAEIERVAARDVKALPGLAKVGRAKNHAVRTARPNRRHRRPFCVRRVGGAHAAKI